MSGLKEIKVKEKSAETPAQIIASKESLFVFIKLLYQIEKLLSF